MVKKFRKWLRKRNWSETKLKLNNSKESFLLALSHDAFGFLAVLCVCTILSIASLVGCRYVTVNIGFVPANVRTDKKTLEVGIFSICEPSNDDIKTCSYYSDPYYSLGFNHAYGRYYKMYDEIEVGGDGSSSSLKVPGDYKWTGVRIVGTISGSLYLIATILVALTQFKILEFRKEVLSNVTFVAAFAECIKCACMFLIEMCVAPIFIDNTNLRNEGSYLAPAEDCTFNKLSVMSTLVIVTSTLVLCVVNRNRIIPESKPPNKYNETETLYENESRGDSESKYNDGDNL